MTKSEAFKFVLLRSIGNFLLLFAIYGVFATFGPALYYEVQFRVIEARGIHFNVGAQYFVPINGAKGTKGSEETQGTSGTKAFESSVPFVSSVPSRTSGPGFSDILAGSKEQILIPKDTQFSIVIPKIGATAKIFPNVDPDNQKEFLPVLQQGIAHAKGSVFPGMPGNVYLFAHSTDNWWDVGRYNAVFYLLQDVRPGDEIVIFFEDRRYEYVVSQKIITGPTDVSQIARDHSGQEQLVLQTCWPPGTTWKRLYVIAAPKSS